MILLDTNVLSEMMKSIPNPTVKNWLDNYSYKGYAISAVTQAEILLGLNLLPAGKQRDDLTTRAQAMFDQDIRLIYPFDSEAAIIYSELVAKRRRLGLTASSEDGQIAATALRYDCDIATRNVKDFASIADLKVINPWQS